MRDLARPRPAMLHALVLAAAVASEPSTLSPEAAEHNTRAMVHYDAGQFGPAVDEFFAAYQAMPDPRRHRQGRQQLLGAMSMALRDLHDITHAPAPLCRLRTILQGHADALVRAYPDEPNIPELGSVRWNLEDATRLLAAYGPDACEPPLAPAAAAPPAPVREPATSTTLPVRESATPLHRAPPDDAPARPLRIAGAVTLGPGVALLGGVVAGVLIQHEQRARAREFDARQPDRYLTRAESDQLRDHLERAQFGRRLAVGTGVAAGVMIATGAALLVLSRRPARARRWSAAPWWSTTGAGLTVRVQLGPER